MKRSLVAKLVPALLLILLAVGVAWANEPAPSQDAAERAAVEPAPATAETDVTTEADLEAALENDGVELEFMADGCCFVACLEERTICRQNCPPGDTYCKWEYCQQLYQACIANC